MSARYDSRHITADFTVTGSTATDLQAAAEAQLVRLAPPASWRYDLHIEPLTRSFEGVVSWTASVSAEVVG